MTATTDETDTLDPTTHDNSDAPRACYAILDGRSCKALALACSTEETRPLLQHARLRRDATLEATNGHILTRMTPTLLDADGLETEDRMYHTKRWLVHRDVLKRLRVSQSLRLDLGTGELVVLDKDGEPELVIPGGAAREEEEGDFPDTDRVYRPERRPECFRFRLAARYLARIAKLTEAAGLEAATLEVPREIEAQTSEGARGAVHGVRYVAGDTHGLVMPWRMDR